MIQILNYNGWEYVSFIYEDNDYGITEILKLT